MTYMIHFRGRFALQYRILKTLYIHSCRCPLTPGTNRNGNVALVFFVGSAKEDEDPAIQRDIQVINLVGGFVFKN